MDITVRDDPDESRYEIRVDGAVAGFSTYKLRNGRIAFIHTEIDDALSGRGLAGRLIGDALDDARRRGLSVLPFCPFVRRFLAENPSYLDLVPGKDRGRFGLPVVAD
jgi:predicted GNAT family acetyltransferase